MDSLTHIVLGAAVGQVVLGKEAGNKALLWGAIAGTLPDLDIIPGQFVDTVTRLELHRGFSHSLLFAITGAPLLGWMVSKINKKYDIAWYKWSYLFFWCIIGHIMLDNFTTWGTQVFYPFQYRIAWRTIFVIDPLYTLPFLIFMLLVFFGKDHRFRRRMAYIGLAVSSCYLLLGIVNKNIASRAVCEALINQNIKWTRYETFPSPFNIILWVTNVETDSGFYMGYYSLLDKDNNIHFTYFTKNHYLTEGIEDNPELQRLIRLSKKWYKIVPAPDGIIYQDLRFSIVDYPLTPQSRFAFSYLIKKVPDSNPGISVTRLPRNYGNWSKTLLGLWHRIFKK